MVVGLGQADAFDPIGVRGRRCDRRCEMHRLLLQHAGGVAGGVALDPAGVGVGRRVGDADRLERLGVEPHAVVVAVGEHHRPVRDHGVEFLAGRQSSWEVAHRPAAAENPVTIGVLIRVGLDRLPRGLATGDLVERALGHAVTRRGGVAVGVVKAGKQHSALHVDHARRRSTLLGNVGGMPDGGDAAIGDRDRRCHSAGCIDCVNHAIFKDEVCCHGRVS